MKIGVVHHKQHSFRVVPDKFSFRSYPMTVAGTRQYNFRCERCGTTDMAYREGDHWKGWKRGLDTCGDVLARQVHEA